MVKINPKSKIWFLTRIGREIEWRIEKRKRICLQNLIPSRREREFFSKSRISRGEREFVLQNLDIREHLEKWKFNSPARDRKKWTISSRDFLEIENLVNAWMMMMMMMLHNGTWWYMTMMMTHDCTWWYMMVQEVIQIWNEAWPVQDSTSSCPFPHFSDSAKLKDSIKSRFFLPKWNRAGNESEMNCRDENYKSTFLKIKFRPKVRIILISQFTFTN